MTLFAPLEVNDILPQIRPRRSQYKHILWLFPGILMCVIGSYFGFLNAMNSVSHLGIYDTDFRFAILICEFVLAATGFSITIENVKFLWRYYRKPRFLVLWKFREQFFMGVTEMSKEEALLRLPCGEVTYIFVSMDGRPHTSFILQPTKVVTHHEGEGTKLAEIRCLCEATQLYGTVYIVRYSPILRRYPLHLTPEAMYKLHSVLTRDPGFDNITLVNRWFSEAEECKTAKQQAEQLLAELTDTRWHVANLQDSLREQRTRFEAMQESDVKTIENLQEDLVNLAMVVLGLIDCLKDPSIAEGNQHVGELRRAAALKTRRALAHVPDTTAGIQNALWEEHESANKLPLLPEGQRHRMLGVDIFREHLATTATPREVPATPEAPDTSEQPLRSDPTMELPISSIFPLSPDSPPRS